MRLFICLLFSSVVASSLLAANRILVFGDSITGGFGVAKQDCFVERFKDLIRKEHISMRVAASSTDGLTVARARDTLALALRRSAPLNICIIELGGMDWLNHTAELDFIAELSNLTAAVFAHSPESHIFILLIGYSDSDILRAPATFGRNVTVISGFRWTDPQNYNMRLPDGLHPNKLGHEEMAKRLAPEVILQIGLFRK